MCSDSVRNKLDLSTIAVRDRRSPEGQSDQITNLWAGDRSEFSSPTNYYCKLVMPHLCARIRVREIAIRRARRACARVMTRARGVPLSARGCACARIWLQTSIPIYASLCVPVRKCNDSCARAVTSAGMCMCAHELSTYIRVSLRARAHIDVVQMCVMSDLQPPKPVLTRVRTCAKRLNKLAPEKSTWSVQRAGPQDTDCLCRQYKYVATLIHKGKQYSGKYYRLHYQPLKPIGRITQKSRPLTAISGRGYH